MPSSPGYVRDYKRESSIRRSPLELAKNASRKRARRKLEKEGKVRKFDGKDVDHRNRNSLNNSPSNLAVKNASSNRSFSRKANAGKYAGGSRRRNV